MRTMLLTATLALAAASPCLAGSGENAFNFLFLDAAARPVAMGGAYTALASDANALLYNPAGLGRVARHEATFMHNEYLQGLKQEYLALATKQGFGLSLNYLSFGDIPRTTISKSAGTGSQFAISDLAAAAGYGRSVLPDLSLGVGLKFIRETIDDVQASGYALDAGALYLAPWVRGLSLAAAVQNAGPSVRFQKIRERPPTNARFGAAYEFKLWGNRDVVSVDVAQPRGDGLLVSAGAETMFPKGVSLRAGFNARNDADIGLTAGMGWRLKNVAMDYAVVPFGDLGMAHRMSVTVRWGRDRFQSREEHDAADLMSLMAAARRHLKAGRQEKARAKLAAARPYLKDKDPLKIRWFEMAARIARLGKNLTGAKAAYIQGLDLARTLGLRDRVVAESFLGLGLSLEEEGNKAYAVQIFEKGLALEPAEDLKTAFEGALARVKGEEKKPVAEEAEKKPVEEEKKD